MYHNEVSAELVAGDSACVKLVLFLKTFCVCKFYEKILCSVENKNKQKKRCRISNGERTEASASLSCLFIMTNV